MSNFSIFLHEIDGNWYEFGYYEYTGDDYEGDMAKLAAEPRNQAWLKVCDAMQIPLKGENDLGDDETESTTIPNRQSGSCRKPRQRASITA